MYMRNYVKKADCPPGLDALIQRVNELIPRMRLKILKLRNKNDDSEAAKALEERLKDTPVSFQKYIKGLGYSRADLYDGLIPVTPENFIKKTIEVYNEFCLDYYSLTRYVDHLELERKTMNAAAEHISKETGRKVKIGFDHYKWMNWDTQPVKIVTIIKRRGNQNYLTGLAGLIGKFDDSRLRKCKICARIFWAKKTNAETCGLKKCAADLGNKKRSTKSKTKENKLKNIEEQK